MQTPSTLQDIEALIRDRVQEDLHLDYKDSRALSDTKGDEIAKDVSAFANADGGLLIYGVQEDKQTHMPLQIDSGVDSQKFSKEWLEQIIMSRITPIIDGVRIIPISVGTGKSMYVVSVPKSLRGPHQAHDKKYYKRSNFISQAMEDYEIRDVRNRRHSVPPLLTFEIFDYRRFVAAFDIANVGEVVAEDVTFEFLPSIPWPTDRQMPQLFDKGVHKFPPKQRLRFLYFTFPEILSGKAGVPMEFEVRIKYFHPDVSAIVTDVWPITFSAHEHSIVMRSEIEEQAIELVKDVKELTDQAKKIQLLLETFRPIIGSTGLALSVPALRNLGRVLRDGDAPERIQPAGQDPAVFREILGVNIQMAWAICNSIGYNNNPKGLADIPGMTPELMARIRTAFVVPPSEDSVEEQCIKDQSKPRTQE